MTRKAQRSQRVGALLAAPSSGLPLPHLAAAGHIYRLARHVVGLAEEDGGLADVLDGLKPAVRPLPAVLP